MYGIREARRDARRNVLTRTEEVRLHAAYLSGNGAAGRRLVNSFLPALSRSARAVGMPAGHGQDMLGVAVQAFLENLFRYDPSTGCRIWTYMKFVVRHAVGSYASANRTFFRMTTASDRIAATHLDAEKKKLGACGRPLTGREARHLAGAFGVSECVIHGMDDDMSVMRPDSLHGDRKHEGHAVEDPERVGGHLDFERRHDHDWHMQRLGTGLATLGERQREVIARRFKETPDTLQDLADDMGVSRERIRQIEGVALRKLRHAIERPGETPPANASLQRRYDRRRRKSAKPRNATRAATTKRSAGRGTTRRKVAKTKAAPPRTA